MYKKYFLIGGVFVLLTILFVSANSNVVNLSEGLKEFFLEISKGNIAGTFGVNKFGSRDGLSTSYEDIWDGGNNYTFPTIARKLNVTSSSTSDTSAGTGARTMIVQGLDQNWNQVTEEVTLNGQSHVETTNQYIRVFRMRVNQSGSNEVNVGTIYIFNGTSGSGVPDGASSITAQILPNNGQTLMAIYTIPNGKTGYLHQLHANSAASKAVTIQLFVRPFGESKNIKYVGDVQNFLLTSDWLVPQKIPEKSDVWVRGKVDTGNTRVSAVFDIILVDN